MYELRSHGYIFYNLRNNEMDIFQIIFYREAFKNIILYPQKYFLTRLFWLLNNLISVKKNSEGKSWVAATK